MTRINAQLGLNYIYLLAVSPEVRERLEQYACMETYAIRVAERMKQALDEQTAHALELSEYAKELERRGGGCE